MPPNIMNDLMAYLTRLMIGSQAMFETLGNNLFRDFALILLAWFGIQCAMHGAVPMERFVSMIWRISLCLAMTRFYSTPIPGLGISFSHLIVDQGTALANQLNQGIYSSVMSGLDKIYWGTETPGLSAMINVIESLRWALIIVGVFVAQAAVFGVIAFGYVAVAIGVLIGPVFIPFFIVPDMEWMFWGWFRAMLQYAFYPVIANAYLFVFGNLLINYTAKAGTDLSGPQLAVSFGPLLFLLIAFTWGIFKIPSLTNSFFTGKSGESAVPSSW